MKKDTFLKLINIIPSLDSIAEPLYSLGIDITECSIISAIGDLVGSIAEDQYGEDGKEWIEWWIYEKANNPDLNAYEEKEDGTEVEINKTVDDLYNYLENNERKN